MNKNNLEPENLKIDKKTSPSKFDTVERLIHFLSSLLTIFFVAILITAIITGRKL